MMQDRMSISFQYDITDPGNEMQALMDAHMNHGIVSMLNRHWFVISYSYETDLSGIVTLDAEFESTGKPDRAGTDGPFIVPKQIPLVPQQQETTG